MVKSVVQHKVFGFRITPDEAKPVVIVAPDIEEAVSIWLTTHERQDPFDISFIGTAYLHIDLPI